MKHIFSRPWPSMASLRNQEGFTIIELMVAITVFALLMAAAALGLNGALNLTRNNRSRAVAANLASQTVDNIQATSFNDIYIGNQTLSPSPVVDGVTYTVETNTEWVGPTTLTSDCAGGSSANPAYLRATVQVSWDNMGGALPVQDQTLVTPPVGTFNTNSGNIGVMILDRNAAPREGIPVTLTDSGGASTVVFTTTDGCAFFAYEDPGTYTVSVFVAGNVNDQGLVTPTQTIAVVAGSTVQTQVNYDRSATLQLTMVGGAGGTVPNQMSYTIANTGLLPGGTKRISGFGQTGPNRTLLNAYPYLSGYQVWAGSCLDADPQGQKPSPPGGAYYPGKVRDPALVTNPGVTTTGNINMPTLMVNVKKAGVPLAGATVTMVHAADVGNGCTSGQSFQLQGTTDSSGNILAAMPIGLWTAQVSGQTATSGVWPSITLSPPSGTTTRVINVAVN